MSEVMDIIQSNSDPFLPIIKLRNQCNKYLLEKDQRNDILYRNDNISYIDSYRLKHNGKFPTSNRCYYSLKSLFGRRNNKFIYDFYYTELDGNLSEETLVNHIMSLFSNSLVNGFHSTTYHACDEEECYTLQIPENPNQEFSIMDWPISSEKNTNGNNISPVTPITPSIFPSSSSINSNSITLSPMKIKRHHNNNVNVNTNTLFVLSPIASPIPVTRKAFMLSSLNSDEESNSIHNNNHNREDFGRNRTSSFDPTSESLPNYVDL